MGLAGYMASGHHLTKQNRNIKSSDTHVILEHLMEVPFVGNSYIKEINISQHSQSLDKAIDK